MGGYVTVRPGRSLANGIGTAGTAQQNLETTGRETLFVSVRAENTNSGTVFVGPGGTTNGWPLTAGQSIDLAIAGTDRVQVHGSAAGQVYRWMAILP